METRAANLAAALAQHDIHIDPDRIPPLQCYCQTLWSWNEKLNLTRHMTYDRFATRDVVDSLALAPWIPSNARVLDAGTGGGVPGVVLAILRPDLQMSLCESVGKKFRAVEAIVAELGLAVTAYHARLEKLLATANFDTLVARAIAPLPRLLAWLEPHRDRFDQLLVVKGRSWQAECQQARIRGLLKSLQLTRISTYRTPGSHATNVILQIRRTGRGAGSVPAR
ncbi:MAG: 16S rRNA (guanine(527)-N(7))-methyltransferase RsmG [Planctomycetes bacterium RBG_16_64_10]|nr:MAG: 16S rRNA (guanine(527)-N(7))-methyltransferase RsmG [Planctomycetes bacterium RBG_16_64_10]